MIEFDSNIRRLPVYLLLDCSGSMNGEPIEAVRQGIKHLLSELRGDPNALESVWLSVITFDSVARQVVPLTELMAFHEPVLQAGGTTALGAALRLLSQQIEVEVRRSTPTQKGDWRPLVFLMTDGNPTDEWEDVADDLKRRRPGTVVACGAGSGVDRENLRRITDSVVMLQDYAPDTFRAFFAWVSASVMTTSQKIVAEPTDLDGLPTPPPQITVIR